MFTTVEDYQFIFPQKFSSGDYFFVYNSDDNNVFGLIQHTPDNSNTLESDIPDEDVVDNMLDDIMEAM